MAQEDCPAVLGSKRTNATHDEVSYIPRRLHLLNNSLSYLRFTSNSLLPLPSVRRPTPSIKRQARISPLPPHLNSMPDFSNAPVNRPNYFSPPLPQSSHIKLRTQQISSATISKESFPRYLGVRSRFVKTRSLFSDFFRINWTGYHPKTYSYKIALWTS